MIWWSSWQASIAHTQNIIVLCFVTIQRMLPCASVNLRHDDHYEMEEVVSFLRRTTGYFFNTRYKIVVSGWTVIRRFVFRGHCHVLSRMACGTQTINLNGHLFISLRLPWQIDVDRQKQDSQFCPRILRTAARGDNGLTCFALWCNYSLLSSPSVTVKLFLHSWNHYNNNKLTLHIVLSTSFHRHLRISGPVDNNNKLIGLQCSS